MKLIFLDIDGVLNSERSCDYYVEKKSNQWLRIAPWKPHVKQLNRIIKETGAKVVISSTWRDKAYLGMILAMAGFEGDIVGKTPIIKGGRGAQIQAFMDYATIDPASCKNPKKIIKIKQELLEFLYYDPLKHILKIEDFVILDDDSDMAHLMSKLVLVDNMVGLTLKDARKAIRILNGGSVK